MHKDYSALFQTARDRRMGATAPFFLKQSATYQFPTQPCFPFSVFTDIPAFHHSTVCCTLTEDVLATRHVDFSSVFTGGSVDYIESTAASAFFIPSQMYRLVG